MEITHLGHSSFKIVGKDIVIVTDPFKEERVGLKFPKIDADVVTISHDHDDHNNLGSIRGEFICFDSPGEFEIKNVQIVGINSFHDETGGEERGANTIFSYEVDGMKICHLGDLGSDLSSDQIEKIDGVDILFVPVGGKYTIGPKAAIKAITGIGPKIVIPMHYKEGKMDELEPLENFLKEIGKEPKTSDKLKLTKKELPEELEYIILK
jgi:L-ascorbate metabolism protein UlaG (beta-lactamase superfamily)